MKERESLRVVRLLQHGCCSGIVRSQDMQVMKRVHALVPSFSFRRIPRLDFLPFQFAEIFLAALLEGPGILLLFNIDDTAGTRRLHLFYIYHFIHEKISSARLLSEKMSSKSVTAFLEKSEKVKNVPKKRYGPSGKK